MSKYEFNNNCTCSSETTVVSGNSLEVDVNYCESEIRADVVVEEYSSVRLWGQIVNCDGKPISNALIKLLKVELCGKHVTYRGVSHTISDCEGFYQFELCGNNEDHECYKLLVSKAACGPEKIVPISNVSCNPCEQCEPTITPPLECYEPYPNEYQSISSQSYFTKTKY
ncbi:MAG: hypothetical protein ACRC3Y_13775 [Romboutsia sp.]|uniref:hypothetical protein n=1 Tax=Romboutsia sp. TaxID=1965302 RepID=UPI003F35A4D2